jgi:hypothetical protein
MQKLINVIALLSGLTSAALIGGSAYVLLNKDALIDSAKEQAIEQVTKSVTEALPGMIKDQMPELPTSTGGAIPF